MGKTYTKREKQKIHKPWFNPGKDEPVFLKVTDREWKACVKKTGAYQSERLADQAVEKLMEETGALWKSYKCEFCKKYHVTKSKLRT